MAVFYLKKRDTRPVLEVALKNPDGSAHDLTGVTGVKLHVLVPGGVFTRPMEIVPPDSGGVVRYTAVAADWAAPEPFLIAGDHKMEYEVIGSGDARLTFPNDAYDRLSVLEDLGQG